MKRVSSHLPASSLGVVMLGALTLLASAFCHAAPAAPAPGRAETEASLPALTLRPSGWWEWEYAFRTGEAPSVTQKLHLEMAGAVAPQIQGKIVFEHKGVWGAGGTGRVGGTGLVGSPVSSPLLRTSEAYVELHPGQLEGWGSWRLGRLRFQLGPVGLLSANPFDALEGVHWQKSRSDWLIEAVWARLDTSYVTYLNYVYDTDEYVAIHAGRVLGGGQTAQAGITWLADGLAGERGVALDFAGTLTGGRRLVIELAGYEASRTSYDYQGWVGAAAASIDLWVDERQTLSLTAASVHPGFTPMASNLRSAGGSIPFFNGSTGVELYASRLIRVGAVGEIEVRHQVRWGEPLSELRLGVTVAGPGPGVSTGRLQWTRKGEVTSISGSAGFQMAF
ncbi:MAG: hypothetical protein IMX00_08665 [Limnochordales bacterium]|nr:hypothetical protein [Limnochordales bacterium]